MSFLPWILMILGAAINFIVAEIIKKNEKIDENKKTKLCYIVKTLGLWLVIIGAFLIFKENGSFGLK